MHVVTDAVADIPPWLRERVNVVPLRVIIKGSVYSSAEFKAEDLHKILVSLKPGEMNTSQPSPKDFMKVFDRLGGPIVYIAASSRLSGTINAAKTAARMLGRDDIYIIDSLNASVGQGLLTYYALTLTDAGLPPEEVARRVEEKRTDIRVYLTVGSLDYLKATGRISAAAAFLGKALDLVPILSIEDGIVKKKGVVRRGRVVDELAKLLDQPYVWAGHVAAPERARELISRLHGRVESMLGGPVISVHIGPGTFGGGFIRGFNPSR